MEWGEYLEANTVWIATLSNGDEVVQDDRPGHPNAWLALARQINDAGISLVGLRLRFRTHEENPLPRGADGYFFCRAISGTIGEVPLGFYLVGALQDGVLTVQKWKVPELILMEAEPRDPATAGPCLIVASATLCKVQPAPCSS